MLVTGDYQVAKVLTDNLTIAHASVQEILSHYFPISTYQPAGYIFFPGLFFIILSYFDSFMVVWGFGVGV